MFDVRYVWFVYNDQTEKQFVSDCLKILKNISQIALKIV